MSEVSPPRCKRFRDSSFVRPFNDQKRQGDSPPSCLMASSKVTRVSSDGFSKGRLKNWPAAGFQFPLE